MKNEIKDLELFTGIREETLDELNKIGHKMIYKKGEHVFYDKDNIKTIFIVLTGKVALYKISEKAQKRIVFILGRGKIINDVILDDLKSSINCEVFEDSEIFCFNREQFIKLMEKDFDLTKAVLNSLAKKVRRLYRQVKNSTPIKIEKRVAAKLWKLGKDYGIDCEKSTLINLNISITYLADMFGTPRETISRAVKVLQNEGLIIVKDKKFIIKDREKLAEYFKK